jgi:microcystin-dependent protein
MSEPFYAEIKMFGGNFAPRGYAMCNGQILPIAQNTALFSLLGTTYGGNGQTTFALPDLRGRVPVHPGQGPGLPPVSLGESSGEPHHTLISTEMPQHNHLVGCTDATADANAPSGKILATDAAGVTGEYSSGAATATMNPQTIGVAGGSQPHNNMQPYLGVTFIIALEGIYPSRN